MVSSRRQQNVEETVRQLQAEGLQVAGTACHVGDRAQLQKLIQFALDTFGGLDVLVSNAAVNPASGPIMTMEVSWHQRAAAAAPAAVAVAAGTFRLPHVPEWQRRRVARCVACRLTLLCPFHPCCCYCCCRAALQDTAIEKIVDINITSAVLLAKAAVPHMPAGGSIVFVSSYTAFNPAPPIAM